MKKTAAVLSLAAMISGMLPNVLADDALKTVGNSEYICVDLKEYANCTAFGLTGAKQEGTEYVVPDFMGVGRKDNTDGVNNIYNKRSFDEKKDAEGFIYDESGRPFAIATGLEEKNTVLISPSTYVANRTAAIYPAGKKCYDVSFVFDTTYNLGKNEFECVVEYKDGTKTTDADWVIYPSNKANISAMDGVSSVIPFVYRAETEEDADLAYKTGCLFKMKNPNPAEPDKQNYSLPVYTMQTDPDKTISAVKITSKDAYIGLNLFAVTMHCVTKKEELEKDIDTLPESGNITYENYEAYKETVYRIYDEIRDGVDIDAERKNKLSAIYEKIYDFENNPASGINYLIDKMPEAEDINEENFGTYLAGVKQADEKISKTGVVLDETRKVKFEKIKEKVYKLAKNEELRNKTEQLPKAEDINENNYADYTALLEEIEELIESGGELTKEAAQKYSAVKKAVEYYSKAYKPYAAMDISGACNALVYADYGITLKDEKCRTPYYLGARQSDATVQYYPTAILNRKAFENLKRADGLIYSDKKKIPLMLDTKQGIILGSNGEGKIHKTTVDLTPGCYESVSFVIAGTYEIEPEQFMMKVNYADGTSTVDPDWKLAEQKSSPKSFENYPAVDDFAGVVYDAKNIAETAPELVRSGNDYNYISNSKYYPVFTLETDSEKIVTSVEFSQTDEWRAIAILGITAKFPPQDKLKALIEENIEKTDESALSKEGARIGAVANMLEAYAGKNGSDIIENIDRFRTLQEKYNNSVVQVTKVGDSTDFEKTTVLVEFKNAVLTENLDKSVTLTENGKQTKDYTLNVLSDKSFEITVKNDLDYDKKYLLTLSSALPAKADRGFTLSRDYTYEFSPKAPAVLEELRLTTGIGGKIESPNEAKGAQINVSAVLKNNTVSPDMTYAMTLCLFGENNELLKIFLYQSTLGNGDVLTETAVFDIPGGEGNYSIKCYVYDSFAMMNKIVQTETK